MLEDIYDIDDNLREDDYYDALIFILGDVYPDLSEDELEDVLENMINQAPEQYSENFLSTVGNVGKSIGTGSLKFLAEHPEITQTVGSAVGGYVGGPVGAKVGNELANFGNKELQKNFLPATSNTLSLMQNPQAQTAITRASLGIGNGTAPLVQDGKSSLIPVATYLRAIIASAQDALKELDSKNIIPPASLSESLPYAEDIDRQAEWLAETLSH
jgi:hypothetical protein